MKDNANCEWTKSGKIVGTQSWAFFAFGAFLNYFFPWKGKTPLLGMGLKSPIMRHYDISNYKNLATSILCVADKGIFV